MFNPVYAACFKLIDLNKTITHHIKEIMSTHIHHSEESKAEFKLKPLSKEGVPAALAKADKYRLLNDPVMAESICLDILDVEPENEKAAVILLLALTDQFGVGGVPHAPKRARELVAGFKDEFIRVYYSGLINERRGTASMNSGIPGSGYDAYEWYRDAMELYEKAETLQPPGDNDSILRWNTCARIIMQHKLKQRPKDDSVSMLE